MTRLVPLMALLGCVCVTAVAVERFPPPDFVETAHEPPETTTPPARSDVQEFVDVAALFVALCAASYLILKTRSRRGVFVVMLLSLAYFGFYRKGCVCSIGAIQNVAYALAGGYAVPAAVVAFFLLPLAFTLLFGRTFCAGVCPLGAIQDVVLLRPVKVPAWLEHGLGLLPYAYLGAAVLFAATGSAFVICRYDPFVSLFRLSGELPVLILGGCVLLIALFVGRPYCRYLCPYGAVLRHLSRAAKWHATITPEECVQCRLCEDSCPFGAIQKPTPDVAHDRQEGKARLAALAALLPVFIVVGGLVAAYASRPLSRVHATVRLAERIEREDAGLAEGSTEASAAFRGTGRPTEELYDQADQLRRQFTRGGWVLGGFLGLVIGAKLIELSIRRRRTDYLPDRAKCLSCARCFRFCPVERQRLKKLEETPSGA